MKKLSFSMLIIVVASLIACKTTVDKKEAITQPASAGSTDPEFNKDGLNDLSESSVMLDVLCQNWDNRQDLDDNHGITESESIQLVNRGFCFFKDYIVIKDIRGEMKVGKWSLNQGKKPFTINIKYNDGSAESYQIAVLKPFELTLNSGAAGDKKLVEYAGSAISCKNLIDDPFYIANNEWRIKPSKAENDQQIKIRMKSFIHFFVLFYEHNINSKPSAVDFNGLPSCFKWYAGGVFIYKENEIPAKWVNCFYNKEQALKGYKIAEDLVSRKYKFPKGQTNWLKANLMILKKMEENL